MNEYFLQGLQIYFGIGFFLIVTGLLLRLCLTRFESSLPPLNRSLAALLVESFLLSILINGALGVVFSLLEFGIDQIKYALVVIDLLLLVFFINSRREGSGVRSYFVKKDRLDLMAAVVIMIFSALILIQGGVLDMLADGWWHMAYVDQMVFENSLLIKQHPITGSESAAVLYPPLWHLQLALISEFSGLDLPIIWHFVAALNAALLLSALHRLTFLLTGRAAIALIAVILHIFLIGGLSSYARVGSWPGNFAYVLLYYSFALTFVLADHLASGRIKSLKKNGGDSGFLILVGMLFCLLVVMTGLHGVASALFLLGIFAYFITLGIFQSRKSSDDKLFNDQKVTQVILIVGAIVGVILALTIFESRYKFLFGSPPAYYPYLSLIIPVAILIAIGNYNRLCRLMARRLETAIAQILISLMIGAAIVWSIDFSHFRELLIPNPEPIGRHVPRDFQDAMGNWVFLPFWEHQLRGGLLPTGILGLFLGLALPIFSRDRVALFLFSLSSLALLVLFSPYFFTLTAFVIPLASTYRVSLLLFSPIIFSVVLYRLARA